MRAFLAFELPAAIRTGLAATSGRLRTELGTRLVRWVAAEAVHLTLVFLDEIDPRTADQVSTWLDQTCGQAEPVGFEVGGLGAFPNLGRPRVIWIGIRPLDRKLGELQATLESGIRAFGIEVEARPYHPHLTLGRVRREPDRDGVRRLASQLQAIRVGELGRVTAEGVSLMRSELTPAGAVYHRHHHAALGRRS